MADTHPNIALVQRMYECFNRNDMDTIRNEIFAPDLLWNLPGRHPLSGVKHGAEEVLAFLTAPRKFWRSSLNWCGPIFRSRSIPSAIPAPASIPLVTIR